jgi:hypothetical protein
VDELAVQKVDIVKIWVDDRNGQYKKLTPELYGAVIDEAHKNKLRVTAHLFTLEDAKGLWKAGIDAFAHGVRDRDVDAEFLAMVKTRPQFVLVPNLPDRGVKTDLSWLRSSLSEGEYQKLEAGNTDRPEAQMQFGIPGAQPRGDEQGRRSGRARHRRQHAMGAARGDGRYGVHRDDADAGDRCRDAQRRRVPAHDRCRHD